METSFFADTNYATCLKKQCNKIFFFIVKIIKYHKIVYIFLRQEKIPGDVSHTIGHRLGLKLEIKYVKFLCDSYRWKKEKKAARERVSKMKPFYHLVRVWGQGHKITIRGQPVPRIHHRLYSKGVFAWKSYCCKEMLVPGFLRNSITPWLRRLRCFSQNPRVASSSPLATYCLNVVDCTYFLRVDGG